MRLLLIVILAGLAFLQGQSYSMVPNPSVSPTPTRQHRKVTPEPTVEATPNPPPTEEPPLTCIQECKAACKEAGLKWKDCKDDCDCLGGE